MVETKTNIYQALLAAQKDMGPVYKNATNPAFRSKYADLSAVIETITEPLQKHGIVFTQRLGGIGENVTPVLNSALIHVESGEMIESICPIICKDMQDPQKFGAAITYMRRYSLLSLLGLAPEDDDGNLASTPTSAPRSNATSADRQSATPRQTTTSRATTAPQNGADTKCEIPSCTNYVKAEKVETSRKYNKGHVVCYFHSTNGNWEEQLEREIYEAEVESELEARDLTDADSRA